MKTSDPKVACFDVFDTVLTRVLGSPESIFVALGRSLALRSMISCTPETFARARVDAEARAYRNAGGECRLAAIYVELAGALQQSPSEAQRVMAAELDMERALIRAVPGAATRVEQARALGQKVVFVSDTYLPGEFVRQQLAWHGLWREGDGCYASCEHGRSKRSGELFHEVLAAEGIPPRLAFYRGNSLDDDLRPAARCGLATEPFLDANLNGFEALLERHSLASEGLASALAGASRLTRLALPAATERESILRDVAAGVGAPALTGFVLWLLRRADQLGLKRLYFLSRDGQVLLDLANRMAGRLGVSCELRYLYASRQSWNPAGIATGDVEELAWIWDTTDFLSVRSLLARLDLPPESLRSQLEDAGWRDERWDDALSADDRRRLAAVLRLPEVRQLILGRAREKRRILLAYLTQEGVLEPGSWGLVDLGWYGSLQNTLSRLIAEARGVQPIGFYFALLEGAIKDSPTCRREAYYFDEHARTGYRGAVRDLIPLMEMLCVGAHGTVVDFVEEGGRIAPVLKEPLNQPVLDWGLPVVRQAIAGFAENLVLDRTLVNPWVDIRQPITDVLNAFWIRPPAPIAQVWAEFPWEDGLGRESYRARLASAFGWRHVARAVLRGRLEPHHRAGWLAGSIALSPRGVRFALARVVQTRRVWRRVRARLGARLQQRRASRDAEEFLARTSRDAPPATGPA